jgi:hypothetical protein
VDQETQSLEIFVDLVLRVVLSFNEAKHPGEHVHSELVTVVLQGDDEEAEILLSDFLESESVDVEIIQKITEFLTLLTLPLTLFSVTSAHLSNSFLVDDGDTFQHLLDVHGVLDAFEFASLEIG